MNKKPWNLLAILLSLQLSSVALAKTLIISDIDDTIKISNVKQPTQALIYLAQQTNSFAGMADLYQEILQNNPKANLYYVSNAPVQILDSHYKTFLQLNNFPNPDGAYLRQNIFDSNHKYNQIIRLINAERPHTLVLIGDDGEQDSVVYNKLKMTLEPLNYKVIVFIRQLYTSKNIPLGSSLAPSYPGQRSYISPLDIALELNQEQLLPIQSINRITDKLITHLKDQNFFSSSWIIPLWADCSDYQGTISVDQLPPATLELQNSLLNSCK